MVLFNLLLSTGGTLLAYGVYRLLCVLYAQYTSPLRDIPGPESPSFLYGNFRQIWNVVQLSLIGDMNPPQ